MPKTELALTAETIRRSNLDGLNEVMEDFDERAGRSSTKAFRNYFPNVVVRDQRVTPALLVLLAWRSTFVDDQSGWGINEKNLKREPIVKSGSGLGKNNIRAALVLAQAPGMAYLTREQAPRWPDGRWGYAVDKLSLPPAGKNGHAGRHVKREWFDASLSLNAMAAFLFVRAGTGKGPSVYAREVGDRFSWSRPTTTKILAELLKCGLLERSEGRLKGRYTGVHYTPAKAGRWKIWTAVKKPGSGLPGVGKPGDTHTPNPIHALSTREPSSHTIKMGHDFSPVGAKQPADLVELERLAFGANELLGSLHDRNGHVSPDLLEVYDDTVYAVMDAMSDSDLRSSLHAATRGRISPVILAPEGLYAVRWLAALAMKTTDEEAYGPEDALELIILSIDHRIGQSKTRDWLNSLGLIGQRVIGANYYYGSTHQSLYGNAQ